MNETMRRRIGVLNKRYDLTGNKKWLYKSDEIHLINKMMERDSDKYTNHLTNPSDYHKGFDHGCDYLVTVIEDYAKKNNLFYGDLIKFLKG